jgi:hypothetical protein
MTIGNRRPLRPDLTASLTYVGLVFGAGFLLGTVRVLLVVPRLGVRSAELLEMPLMAAVVVLAARHVVRRFELPPRLAVRLPVGVFALALMVGVELLVAVALQGRTVAQVISERDPVSGPVYLALLLLFALMPALLR